MKDVSEYKSSPSTGLEWDSYPFSDGDWGPATRQVSVLRGWRPQGLSFEGLEVSGSQC